MDGDEPLSQAPDAGTSRLDAHLRLLADLLPGFTYIRLSEDPRDLYVSPQVFDILGVTQEEWMGDHELWSRHVHPDDRERIVGAWNALVDGSGGTFSEEYRMIAEDGRIVWIDETSVVLDGGRNLRSLGVLLDITGRRRAEERFQYLVEHIPVATYIENPDRGPEGFFMSPQIETLTGYHPDAFLERGFWISKVHEDDRERIAAADAHTDTTSEPFSEDYRFVTADGRTIWVHEEAKRVRESAGMQTSWWGAISDITELKRSEQELAEAMATERAARMRLQELDELKDTLLRAVSHDIRTPLSAILGLGVTLARADMRLDTEDARALAERIVVNARKLDRIVSDVLDLDRLARGEVGIVRAPADLAFLMRGLIDESDALRSRKLTEQLEVVHADVDVSKIERIVDNLLANSVRHSGQDAQIWVRLWADGEDALIVVEDDGPGVPADERERIFDAYHRGEDSPGSGVGLSLVRRFAELHGGTAWVQERDGGGASFRVRVPRKAPKPATEEG